MSEFALWLLAVGKHWVSLMAGIAALGIAIYLRTRHRPDIADWVFWLVAGVCFVAAVFLAWQDQASRVRTLTNQLDGSVRRQQLAADYAPCLQAGQKISVRWSDAVLRKSDEALMESSREGREWYATVESRLRADFGPDVARVFAIGRPIDPAVPLGESQRREHESRLMILSDLVTKMRVGELALRIDPKLSGTIGPGCSAEC